LGIDLLINTDAHSIREYGFMPLGVQQARRGWQSPRTIVNTLPLPSLLKRLRAAKAKA
jgi:DNA polymerase (family 10)